MYCGGIGGDLCCLLCVAKGEAAPAGAQPALLVREGEGELQAPGLGLVSKPRPDLHSSSSSSNQGERGETRIGLYGQMTAIQSSSVTIG